MNPGPSENKTIHVHMEAYHWATTASYTRSHLSLFNYLNIKPQHSWAKFLFHQQLIKCRVPQIFSLWLGHSQTGCCHVTVTMTIIKVVATVKIIWVTLMDLIKFNIKIMWKIKNIGKKHNQKSDFFHLVLNFHWYFESKFIETLNWGWLRPWIKCSN